MWTRFSAGAKPGDIPVEQPTKFDLVINLTTAKALDLNIPELFLSRADEVTDWDALHTLLRAARCMAERRCNTRNQALSFPLSPWCSRNGSAIWRPMVRTGLRLVIGRMRSGSRTRNPRWQARDNMGLMTKERDQ
jgi:hypothetical protein